ncbi:MAG: LysM peptidoglycan-binding domain-containing M23 family metallopeptidase [Leptospiraceae bacterium]|nr:peptidoglycan DD-metalloendopeptidase family protein [Leptospiraceae bacterium]MCK6382358.1 LysM peptidoglycan-binding domain-containing M23 family metallopeptidase [Leptospiraceae bacterium]NUM41448.1 peptidoglycan DD-metalloendopeptidase family protein [Leptospiraceae bacterium]
MNEFFLKIFLFFSVLCLTENTYSEISPYKNYRVSSKDTIYSIAKKMHTTESEILQLNGKKILKILKVGEILKIPYKDKKIVKFHSPLSKKAKIEKKFSEVSFSPFKGILFSQGKDSTVVSAKEGKVLTCDYMDGYENYVIISHSKGYYSLYGNLREIYVIEGQKVLEREKIGMVSASKGLYFQINNDGKPVDPEIFLN